MRVRRIGTTVENWIARLLASAVGLVGLAFFVEYPITRAAVARERADINRAAAPLLSVPLELLQTPSGWTSDLTIPNDEQWRRITERLGSPSFLLVAASAKGEFRRHLFPPPDVGLSSRVLRNGTDVALRTTSDIPDGYSSDAATNTAKFNASPGDRLTISAHIPPMILPAGCVFLVVPHWSTSSASAWAEGEAIGSAIRQCLALASPIVGLVFVWWAFTIAWGRPQSAS
jgi:hypothetical protein